MVKRFFWTVAAYAIALVGFTPVAAFAAPDTSDFLVESGSYEIRYDGGFYYTGGEIRPSVYCMDYNYRVDSVQYRNNTNPGTATVIVRWSLDSSYGDSESGETELHFTICKRDLPTFEISVDDDAYDEWSDAVWYTGKEIRPALEAWEDGLRLGVDYTVSYANNVKPGTAKVVVAGKGLYGGSQTLTFRIKKRSIQWDDFSFASGSSKYAYTGNAVKPKIDSGELVRGKDYVVSYQNNKKIGTATVTMTGIGLYQGKIVKKFSIKRATKVKLNNVYKNTKRITGKVTNVVKGDKIQLKIGGKTYVKKVKKAAKSLKFTFKVPSQTYGKKYTVKVLDGKKKKVASKSSKVWYSNKLKLGQTKKQVKLNPNWGSPSWVNKYNYGSGATEQWVYEYYDSDGYATDWSYLYFRGGRLVSWTL